MRWKISAFAAILLSVLIIGFIGSAATGCSHAVTKNFGGEMTIELEPGQKLEEVTWKEDSLWILTRPMRDNEAPETHTFYEDAEFNVLEGKVTIVEKEE